MNERLFRELAAWLLVEPVVIASVRDTRGATPRKHGARMLIAASRTFLSVGGGAMEARVIQAAREMLASGEQWGKLTIDLTGRAESAGVCGGTMIVTLKRWNHDEHFDEDEGTTDLQRAQEIAAALTNGRPYGIGAGTVGFPEIIAPDPRLLIVGGGHCAVALHELARFLDYDVWVYDDREDCFADGQFAGATHLSGGYDSLERALDTRRVVFAVLLNRDFPSDVATLAVLARRPPAFIGMMGSAKRIGEVRAALEPDAAERLTMLKAPVGIELDAETPHEIAISILAELVELRAKHRPARVALPKPITPPDPP